MNRQILRRVLSAGLVFLFVFRVARYLGGIILSRLPKSVLFHAPYSRYSG